MKRIALLSMLMLSGIAMSLSQTWSTVWRLTTSPYLTRQDITEMAIVKAGLDTDNDGWGEFLCAWTDLDTNAILMYEAAGDNVYNLVWSWVYPVPAMSFAGIAVGDVNNNGIIDIVTTMPSDVGVETNPPRLWVFEWNGVPGENKYGVFNTATNTFDPSGMWNLNAPDSYDMRPYGLTIEDIDNDGANELITGIRQAGTTGSNREIIVASVQGDFPFALFDVEWQYSHTFGGSNYNTTTGDLDNDGNKEIYMFVWDKFTMRIFECTGDRQFTEAFAVDQLYATQNIDYGALDGVRVADVNNDGVKELYIAGTEPPNKVFMITGIADVSQITPANIKVLFTIPVTKGGKLRSMYIADPDHDGNADLMIAGETNGQIFSLEYNGTGDPADSASWHLQVLYDIWKESGLTAISPRLFYGSPAKDMDKDGKDEYVFVNYSPDYGAWANDVPLTVIEIDVGSDVRDESAGVPTDNQLLQNFPNPFNPSTTIPFRLANRSHVRLEVFNIFGQQVASLVDGTREAGYYQAHWAGKVPSGTYFCRMIVEPLDESGATYRDVKKMVLVR